MTPVIELLRKGHPITGTEWFKLGGMTNRERKDYGQPVFRVKVGSRCVNGGRLVWRTYYLSCQFALMSALMDGTKDGYAVPKNAIRLASDFSSDPLWWIPHAIDGVNYLTSGDRVDEVSGELWAWVQEKVASGQVTQTSLPRKRYGKLARKIGSGE